MAETSKKYHRKSLVLNYFMVEINSLRYYNRNDEPNIGYYHPICTKFFDEYPKKE